MPTPSVPETSTGSVYFFGTSNSAPNPPMPPSTPSRIVFLAKGLIASTRASPASMSTPASRYDRPLGRSVEIGRISVDSWGRARRSVKCDFTRCRPAGWNLIIRRLPNTPGKPILQQNSSILTPVSAPALIWVAIALGLGILLWLLSPVLTPFLLGAILAYILQPGVAWMVRRRVPRGLAALLMMLLFTLLMTMLVLLVLAVDPERRAATQAAGARAVRARQRLAAAQARPAGPRRFARFRQHPRSRDRTARRQRANRRPLRMDLDPHQRQRDDHGDRQSS